jgi:outer membrane protein
MKKVFLGLMVVLLPAIAAGISGAEDLAGKLGVTGRIGFTVPADSSWDYWGDLSSDVGFIGGGGVIYGVTRNLALEFETTYSTYDMSYGPYRDGTAGVTDISFGVQWRFASNKKFTPYVGGGLSILINDYTYADVDTVVGANLKGGIDYFITPHIALNAELKGVISPSASMTDSHDPYIRGSFDPSSFSGLFGVRYFFN